MLVGFANSLIWQFSGPNDYRGNTLVNFSLVQPLLRDAGRERVLEGLTQSERTLLAMEAERLPVPSVPTVQVFAVPLGPVAARRLFTVISELRRAGVTADLAMGGRGLKGAMKAADSSGATYAVVLGDRQAFLSDPVEIGVDAVARRLIHFLLPPCTPDSSS